MSDLNSGFKEHLHPKFYEEFNFYADDLDKSLLFSVRVNLGIFLSGVSFISLRRA